jgi:hypothetical protein
MSQARPAITFGQLRRNEDARRQLAAQQARERDALERLHQSELRASPPDCPRGKSWNANRPSTAHSMSTLAGSSRYLRIASNRRRLQHRRNEARPRLFLNDRARAAGITGKDSCKNNFGFSGILTLTPPARTEPLRRGEGPALSHSPRRSLRRSLGRMGEGESSSVRRLIQPLWRRRETGLAVPSPVGRERVRVRVVLFEIRLLSGTCFCANPKWGKAAFGQYDNRSEENHRPRFR